MPGGALADSGSCSGTIGDTFCNLGTKFSALIGLSFRSEMCGNANRVVHIEPPHVCITLYQDKALLDGNCFVSFSLAGLSSPEI